MPTEWQIYFARNKTYNTSTNAPFTRENLGPLYKTWLPIIEFLRIALLISVFS